MSLMGLLIDWTWLRTFQQKPPKLKRKKMRIIKDSRKRRKIGEEIFEILITNHFSKLM
jgi:hypothetical protein